MKKELELYVQNVVNAMRQKLCLHLIEEPEKSEIAHDLEQILIETDIPATENLVMIPCSTDIDYRKPEVIGDVHFETSGCYIRQEYDNIKIGKNIDGATSMVARFLIYNHGKTFTLPDIAKGLGLKRTSVNHQAKKVIEKMQHSKYFRPFTKKMNNKMVCGVLLIGEELAEPVHAERPATDTYGDIHFDEHGCYILHDDEQTTTLSKKPNTQAALVARFMLENIGREFTKAEICRGAGLEKSCDTPFYIAYNFINSSAEYLVRAYHRHPPRFEVIRKD